QRASGFDEAGIDPGLEGGGVDAVLQLRRERHILAAQGMVAEAGHAAWVGQRGQALERVERGLRPLQHQVHRHCVSQASSCLMVCFTCVTRAARSGMLALMRSLSWPASLMWRFFWISVMILTG